MFNCRLIHSQPANGAMNMAVDEALLESAAESGPPDSRRAIATFRIYPWAKPTLSLGYFQHAADRETHESSRDCDLIRRPSGGGAILHDRELTYALVLPAAIAVTRPATQWYYDVHQVLIAAIRAVANVEARLCDNPSKLAAADEPFLCFQRRAAGDVLLGDHKIAGSAQRRRRGAILQHGSVLLGRSSFAPELPGIADLASAEIDYDSFVESFLSEVAKSLDVKLQNEPLDGPEQQTADNLQTAKYGSATWTQRR